MDLTSCPECGHAAEVESREVWEGTDGPVEHATVRCVVNHRFVLPVASLSDVRLAPEVSTPLDGSQVTPDISRWAPWPLVRVRRLPRTD
ncbi:hypothetical protein [Oryzobacter telluris]|uniref:hypothetical protein n=1 Tax=Oryzobacter telluris TaxID=3149179 RepID=UPI00370D4807